MLVRLHRLQLYFYHVFTEKLFGLTNLLKCVNSGHSSKRSLTVSRNFLLLVTIPTYSVGALGFENVIRPLCTRLVFNGIFIG